MLNAALAPGLASATCKLQLADAPRTLQVVTVGSGSGSLRENSISGNVPVPPRRAHQRASAHQGQYDPRSGNLEVQNNVASPMIPGPLDLQVLRPG
jgi:hypothetical protein